MKSILNFIEGQKGKQMEELFEFLRFPSISSDPEFASDVKNCANWLVDHLKQIGFDNARQIPTKGHPIVFAEWLGAGPDAKTLLVYGHYDVQPVDPLELWHTTPFDPFIKDNKIIARGSADDKGQVFAQLKALEAHFKTHGKLPLNVKVIIEGEEEASISHLDDFVLENKELLACDYVVVSDTEWFAEGVPSICYGLRGISFVEVKVTGPNRDLHSGTFGGAVDNPIQVLAWMITQLKDKYGRITVPGFYDDVYELPKEERKNFLKLPFDEEEYKKDLDVENVSGEIGYSTLERTWIRPALDVNGMKGGYIGEGAKTVLPSVASAKISVRLVPYQKPDDITEKLTKYLKSIAPSTCKVEVSEYPGGEPVVVPVDNPAVKAAIRALESAFGKEVVFMREGGSIPIVGLFLQALEAPTVLMGLGLPSDNIHSPNENFDVNNFYGGIRAAAMFLDEMAKI